MARGRGFTRGYSRGRNPVGGGRAAGSRRQPLTHFLCLPLVTESSKPELEASLEQFKNIIQIINERSGGTISEQLSIPLRAIRPVDSLHLTLGVMSLQEEHELQDAIKLLKDLDIGEALESSRPAETHQMNNESKALRISLRSLVSMHTPTDTSVLYAEPMDNSKRLYSFGERLQAKFRHNGFMEEDSRPLKLHATVLNTVYAKSGGGKIRIDATQLLDECKEFSWAQDLRIEKLSICKMGAKKEFGQNGEVVSEKYEEVFSVNLPR